MKLSIIVPVFNNEQYLNICLKSILSQTFQDFELILIDDGSTDSSGDICNQYAELDNRIKVFHKSNAGVSETRNFGISVAMGDYIGFVDSDDYIDSRMYEKMLQRVKEDDSDICVVAHNVVGINHEMYPQYLPFDEECLECDEIKKMYIPLLIGKNNQKKMIGSCCKCIYRLEIAKTISFDPDIKLLEDTLYNIDAALKSRRISIINQCLYHYRVNAMSATNYYRNDVLNQFDLLYLKLQTVMGQLLEDGIDCKENLSNTIYEWILYYLKNLKKPSCHMSIEQKKQCIKLFFDKDYVFEYKKNFKSQNIKQKVFKLLIQFKFYAVILAVM